MPIYTYACKNGHRFDRLLSFADVERGKRVRCPQCKSAGKRQMSDFAEQNSTRNRAYAAPAKQKFLNW